MSGPAESVPVKVTLRGDVGSGAGEYAEGKVVSVLSVSQKPVLYAHVVLDWRRDPAIERHATAEATVDLDGTVVRAKTEAPTLTEAVDELEDRLRRQITELQERTRARQRWTGLSAEHQWRHGAVPRRESAYFPRSPESREVVRRKSFASAPMTVDEAAYEMDLLDHDFFLYVDVDSGTPALVHRLDGGYAVQGGAAPEAVAEAATPVIHDPPPPTLTDDQARTRLEAVGEPFVFYLDAETGEGRVLYLRYDGHYGLIALPG